MAVSTREEIMVGEMTIRFVLEGSSTSGTVACFEFDVPAGARLPGAHSHDGYDETIFGLEGVLTWTVDGAPTEVGQGEALFIGRGVPHAFANTGDVDAKALAIATPGSIGPEYFREVGEILAAAVGGPPDLAKLGAVMRKHGLTPVS